jgi:maltooligosyltrehalose trehalohydrolase
MSYQYPSVGAHLHDQHATFTVWAPLQQKVTLILNGADIPLRRDERGFWSATNNNVRHGDRYAYRLEDQKKYPDPASRWQPEGVHQYSAVVDPTFSWNDEGWRGMPLADMILYELHVGTFTKAGTFDGVISKLDHLRSLGINAIEIMPVAQFPGTRNWGYDGVYPYAVQHSYGGPNGLKTLVNEAHQRGIAVILDVVYNHQGPEGNYFSAFGPYFTDKYKTFWGSAINFDDAFCDPVRQFYIGNALQWLDEFHIDGLRMDAVHSIWDFSARHFIDELREKVKALESATGRTKILIAELDLNNPRYINPVSLGGYGMDGQWIDEFHHALHALMTGEVNGYYEDFGETRHLAKALQDSYVYTGEYSIHRKKHFGVKPLHNSFAQFVVFAQNHDQIGNRLLGDRLTTQLSFEGQKLSAATVLLSPHVPMLFMGEEYGEKNPFRYFISHSDQVLIDNVRKGRREEFKHFNWNGEVPDPQSEKTFGQCVLSWNVEDEASTALLSFYQALITLRKEHPALKSYEREDMKLIDIPFDRVLAFERKYDGHRMIVLLNFNRSDVSVTIPGLLRLRLILDSANSMWLGPRASSPLSINQHEPIVLSAESATVFELF